MASTKIVKKDMYKADVLKAKNAYANQAGYWDSYTGWLNFSAAFITLLGALEAGLGTLTSTILLSAGIQISSLQSEARSVSDSYSTIYDEMTRDENPVLYVTVSQEYTLIGSGQNSGYKLTGIPSYQRHYTDWGK